jgi:hypothetical protein
MERQRDVEIYVRDCPPDRLFAWLEGVVGLLGPAEEAGSALVYPSRVGAVVVCPGIEGGPFVGIWFNTPDSPWRTDVECARQAARELECTVRCDPGKQFAPVHPASDVFLEIGGGEERLVTWL